MFITLLSVTFLAVQQKTSREEPLEVSDLYCQINGNNLNFWP